MKRVLRSLPLVTLLLAVPVWSLGAETMFWPLTALQVANQRATSIQCVSNLKQIMVAARVWSSENGGRCPPGFAAFTNRLASPARLFCPANVGHQAPSHWADFEVGQGDYEWLPEADWNDPEGIACQCRIHNHVVRVSGAVVRSFEYRNGWPAVVASPLHQHATPGSEVRFEVQIAPNSLGPVSYQWRRERLNYVTNVTFIANPDESGSGYWATNRQAHFAITPLSGQTNATYVITDAQTNHSDYYSAVVSNRLGAAASPRARLVIDPSVSSQATNSYWHAVNCVSNLKQIALFSRMWASDHDEHLPQSFSAMTNTYGLPVFGWPVLLYCRFDTARTAPAAWAQVDFADTSYQLLPVNLPADEAPDAPLCRCKVHGFHAQVNGQVVWEPHFDALRRLTNNLTELSFTVFAGLTNRLETSTNLVDWTPLSLPPSPNGSHLIYETNSHPRQFYRIRAE